MKLKFNIFLVLSLFSSSLHGEEDIAYVSVNDMSIESACRMFTHSTKFNVTATAEAQQRTCTFLFKQGSLEEAISSMCVSSGLVYRKTPHSYGFQILTLDEFRDNTVFSANEKIEIFKIEPANLKIIAESIEALFPQEAVFEDSNGVLDLGSVSISGNDSGSSSGGGSNNQNSSSNDNNSGNQRNVTSSNQNSSPNDLGTQLEVLDKKPIKRKTEQLLGTSIYITINEEHSQLIIRTANLVALEKIRTLITRTNLPLRQVLLEMKILELAVGDGEQLGVDWGTQGGAEIFNATSRDSSTGEVTAIEFAGNRHQLGVGNFATQAASTFVYNFLSTDIQARVQALASNNDVEIVATPMLMAVNNREANIVVGEERVIITGASSDVSVAGDNGTRNELITVETEVRTIGTTLSIIPRINNDGTVVLHVNQESSSVSRGDNQIPTGGELVSIDSVNTANIVADVVAQHGKTIAVGGLIRTENSKTKDKVPLLGDIPLLGKAFKRESTTSQKTELILLITPYIIDGGNTERTRQILKQSKHRYQTEGIKSLDDKNQGLKEYETRTSDSLLPSLKKIEKSVNPALPRYYRHPKAIEKVKETSKAINSRRILNRK